jgi:transmembrane sensor
MTRLTSHRDHADTPLTAEEWLARLLSPQSGGADDVFERWRVADPKHAAAYAEAARIHRNAALLSRDALLQGPSPASVRERAASHRAQRRQVWGMAAAIAACLLLTVALVWRSGAVVMVEQHYANANGLPKSLQLADGTRLQLDAESALTVRMYAQLREVTLDRGRAQFAVAHDPQRPFLVHAGNNTIRDIGTVFQVSRSRDGVTVGLLAGRVAISSGSDAHRWTRELRPAEQLHVDASGAPDAIAPLDPVAAAAWTHGELAFRQRRLDDLLTEMNRYSDTQLRLGDPALAALKVSGSFHAGDQDALATALSRGWQLRVARTAANEITLLPANKTGRR